MTVIQRIDLRLAGPRTTTRPEAILDGGGVSTVLLVRQADLTIRDVTITNGFGPSGGGIRQIGAKVVLRGDTSVVGNRAMELGGGIAGRRAPNTLVMRDHASVRDNETRGPGGGVAFPLDDTPKSGRILLYDSATVAGNVSTHDWGGGIFILQGRTVLNDHASVSSNESVGSGGGIVSAIRECPVTLNDAASIEDNRVTTLHSVHSDGGGIALFDCVGPIKLSGTASISGNTATRWGGGVSMWSYYTDLVLRGSASIEGNTAKMGGGVYLTAAWNDLFLHDSSSITGNTATYQGGGIYLEPTSRPSMHVIYVCSKDAVISPNDPDDPPKTRACT